MWETWVQFLSWEDLLEKGRATYSSILAWRILWTEEPGRLQSIWSQRVRHDWATFTSLHLSLGFPRGSNRKEFACNARDLGSVPGLERSPGEGHDNPLQYSCLENPMDWGAWWATVHGITKSWTWLSDQHFQIESSILLGFPPSSFGKESVCKAGDPGSIPESGRSPGERNGYPLQYSCLENSMDRRAGGLQSTETHRVGQHWLTLKNKIHLGVHFYPFKWQIIFKILQLWCNRRAQ